MNWLVDIILVSVFVLTVVVCAARGLVKSIWWLLRAVLSLGAAFLFGQRFARWLMDRFLLEKFTNLARTSLEGIVKENNGGFDIAELFESLPESFSSLLTRFGADADKLKSAYSGATAAPASDINSMAEEIATPVAGVVSNALGYVAVFFGAFLIITIVGWVIGLIAELPVLRGVNRLLGGLFGVICGFIYVWVICLAMSAFVESGIAGNDSFALKELADKSYLFRFFCGFSPFDYINITKIVGALSR